MTITAIATVGAILACPGSTLAANARPDASFGFFPRDPVSGQTIRFVSYACDPDGKLAARAWDLDDDGDFDDALGRTASRSFSAGPHRVRLLVNDRGGRAAIRTRIVDVAPGSPDYVVPQPFKPPLLSPFPVVRLTGSVVGTQTLISQLAVRAPVCSRVTVLCSGGGCPWRRETKLSGRGATRFPEIRRLVAGAKLKVLVSKRDRIGKYTRFRMRAEQAPKRRDRCLRFGAKRGTPCPEG